MASVQFYGLDNVLAAAEKIACPAWAIFVSPTLMFTKYEGTDTQQSLAMLEDHLKALQENNTAGVYTLKFYETEKNKPVKITPKTVCDGGAFNFKLMTGEERQHNVISGSMQYGELSQMKRDIAELKTLLAAPPEEDREETIGSVFMDLLKQPDKLGSLVNVCRGLLNMPPAVQPISSIGAIMQPGEVAEDQEERINRMGSAIDILDKLDPNFTEHLEQLAEMARSRPDQFRTALTMLK